MRRTYTNNEAPTMRNHELFVQDLQGVLIDEREQNLRDDSYFHVTFWNPEDCRVEHEQYAATAWVSTPLHPQTVYNLKQSMFPGVREAIRAYHERERRTVAATVLFDDLRGHYGRKFFKGDEVRVYKGRKVPKGTQGRVIGINERVTHVSRYGTWKTTTTYALIDTGAGFWECNIEHLELVQRGGQVLQELFDLAC